MVGIEQGHCCLTWNLNKPKLRDLYTAVDALASWKVSRQWVQRWTFSDSDTGWFRVRHWKPLDSRMTWWIEFDCGGMADKMRLLSCHILRCPPSCPQRIAALLCCRKCLRCGSEGVEELTCHWFNRRTLRFEGKFEFFSTKFTFTTFAQSWTSYHSSWSKNTDNLNS